MPLRLNDATAIINRTTNLVSAASDYTACVQFRTSFLSATPDYITQLAITDAGYTAWAGIFSNASVSDGTTQISISNGGAPIGTPEIAIVGTGMFVHLGYVRSGTTHQFYMDGVLIGSVSNNIAAVTVAEMLLGNDRFSVIDSPIGFEQFREWDAALTGPEINAEMLSPTVVRTANLITDTPLDTDLLDISGNGNDWSGAGDFDFPPPPLTQGTRVTQFQTGVLQAGGTTRVTQVPTAVLQAGGLTRVTQVPVAVAQAGGTTRVTQFFAFVISGGEPPEPPPAPPPAGCPIPATPSVTGQNACPSPQPGVI